MKCIWINFFAPFILLLGATPVANASSSASTIRQVAVYHEATSQQLYDVFTDAKLHSAATHPASGKIQFIDPDTGKSHSRAAVGYELRGFYLPDGAPGLVGKVLELQPGKRVVMDWKNAAWRLAVDKSEISSMPSILVLEFKNNSIGAEVIMTQIDVPSYPIHMTESPFSATGELAPLSEIIRVHWELAYWQPIRSYLLGRNK